MKQRILLLLTILFLISGSNYSMEKKLYPKCENVGVINSYMESIKGEHDKSDYSTIDILVRNNNIEVLLAVADRITPADELHNKISNAINILLNAQEKGVAEETELFTEKMPVLYGPILSKPKKQYSFAVKLLSSAGICMGGLIGGWLIYKVYKPVVLKDIFNNINWLIHKGIH